MINIWDLSFTRISQYLRDDMVSSRTKQWFHSGASALISFKCWENNNQKFIFYEHDVIIYMYVGFNCYLYQQMMYI